MKNTFVKLFGLFCSYLFVICCISASYNLQATTSLTYYTDILNTYKLQLVPFPTGLEIPAVSVSLRDHGRYIIDSKNFSLVENKLEQSKVEYIDLLIICSDNFTPEPNIVCTRETVKVSLGDNITLSDGSTISVYKSQGMRLIFIPEYNLILPTKLTSTIAALNSLYDINTTPVVAKNYNLLHTYVFPWGQIVGGLFIVAVLLLLLRKPFELKPKRLLVDLYSIFLSKLSDFETFIYRKRFYIFIFTTVSFIIFTVSFCILTIYRWQTLSTAAFKDTLLVITSRSFIFTSIALGNYPFVSLVSSTYVTGFLFALCFATLLLSVFLPFFKKTYSTRPSKNMALSYVYLIFIVLLCMPIIYKSRILFIVLGMDIFMLMRYRNSLFVTVKDSFARPLKYILPCIISLSVVYMFLFFKMGLFTPSSIEYTNLFQNNGEQILLPFSVKVDVAHKRFFSYLISSTAKIFVNNVLVYDPVYKKIITKPLTEFDSSTKSIVIAKSGNGYKKALLTAPGLIPLVTSPSVTSLFVIPADKSDFLSGSASKIKIVFDCSKDPTPFAFNIKSYRAETSKLRENITAILQFPGCAPKDVQKEYTVSVSTLHTLNELDKKDVEFIKSIEFVVGPTIIKPIYLKDPKKYSLIYDNTGDGGDTLTVFSADIDNDYTFENNATNFDLAEPINSILDKGYNGAEVSIWSDKQDEVIHKINAK
jgi:hypothetical protein